MVLATPVLAVTLMLVAVERILGARDLRSESGRRSAAVSASVLVLFASGRLHHGAAGDGRGERSHHLLSQKRIFGYPFIAFASLAIAVLGFLVWGHHMFVSRPIDVRRDGRFRS